MTTYLVTYCDYETGEHTAADGPVSMDKKEILALMAKVLTAYGSFVSVMDADGMMVQFVLDEDGSVMFDMPYPKKRGSYIKTATLEACVETIENLDDKVKIEAIEGLVFERW